MSAVNTYDHKYNTTAIPVKLGFRQMFIANFKALVYLGEHNSMEDIQSFLENPDGFMAEAGVELGCPFDQYASKIFASLVEDDMLEKLKEPDGHSIYKLLLRDDNNPWRLRHKEKYPKEYMERESLWGLKDISYSLDDDIFENSVFNKQLSSWIYCIIAYFTED